MNKFLLIFLLINAAFHSMFGQDLKPIDTVYNKAVKSIFFYQNNEFVFHPIFFVDREKNFELSFDLLEGSPRNLQYTFYHYDRNWQLSEIDHNEAVTGFEDLEIERYKASKQTLIPYVNYTISLPNRNFKFNYTGNYLLVVFDQSGELLFSRRIFVTSNTFGLVSKFVGPVDASKFRTHVGLELTLKTNNKKIINLDEELSLQVIQNDDYNSIKTLTDPALNMTTEFSYNKIDGILFQGMKEYRRKDIRTVIHLTRDIDYWDERGGHYHCWLEHDKIRAYRPFYSDTDINGKFICTSNDVLEDNIRAEYVMVHFTLLSDIEFDDPVYIYGALSDFQCKEEFKMTYDETKKAYICQVLLKNGFYNYMYVLQDKNGKINISETEGNWYETENDYLILCYYKPLGGRYDQLVLATIINSNK